MASAKGGSSAVGKRARKAAAAVKVAHRKTDLQRKTAAKAKRPAPGA